MGKIVAVDYGKKRIGLAMADRVVGVALPWKVIHAGGSADSDAETIRRELAESDEQIDTIVVGLPLNMDGSEGDQAKLARTFGERLQRAAEVDVEFWDERLTSFAAKDRYDRCEKPRSRRRPIDAVAAAVILEDYLRHHQAG